MKTYRRIEITAFRKRVTIVTGDLNRELAEAEDAAALENTDTRSTIDPASAEGGNLICEAVYLLEKSLADADEG